MADVATGYQSMISNQELVRNTETIWLYAIVLLPWIESSDTYWALPLSPLSESPSELTELGN